MPRSAHGLWEPASDRRDPVELLEEQAATRVPELVPVRYGRMLVSPFTFFRGAAYPMAADLAGAPRTGLDVQLCGDAHLSNFGAFAAPDRRLVFSVNDFDETLPGPFEWDVKRLVASFAVAGRDRGFDAKQRKSINTTVTRSYREAMRDFAGMGNLDLWYARIGVEDLQRAAQQGSAKQVKRFERNVAKARSKDSLKAFAKLTEIVDGEPRIASDPPLIVPIEDVVPRGRASPSRRVRSRHHPLLPAHADDRPPAAARALPLRPRGPQGRRCRQRRHARLDHAPARPRRERPALPPVQGGGGIGARAVPRQEHVRQPWPAGCRRPAPDAGRQRHPARLDTGHRHGWHDPRLLHPPALGSKGSALVETMNPRAMTVYAQLCGRTLAKAHARSGDAVAIASYLGRSDSFDRALASFAETYADQNERDYETLRDAVASGHIPAEAGL